MEVWFQLRETERAVEEFSTVRDCKNSNCRRVKSKVRNAV